MPATQETPRLTTAVARRGTQHKLFVNIPVSNLQRSINFFEAIGFRFNEQFTDSTATCMLVGEDAYFMLLTREKFATFTRRPVGEPWDQTSALFAISVGSRAAVDEMVREANIAGGAEAADPQDHGFMYVRGFYDPDGHHWEAFWMDPTVVSETTEPSWTNKPKKGS